MGLGEVGRWLEVAGEGFCDAGLLLISFFSENTIFRRDLFFVFSFGVETLFMKSVALGIMSMINIRLYDIFRKDLHLPDEKAHELVEVIDEAVKGGHEESLKGVATKEFVKEEIHATKEFVRGEIQATKEFVKEEIQGVKEELRGEIQGVKGEIRGVKGELRGEIQELRKEINRVELKVEQTKSELTKSIYLTSLIQVLVIVGSIIGIITFIFRK